MLATVTGNPRVTLPTSPRPGAAYTTDADPPSPSSPSPQMRVARWVADGASPWYSTTRTDTTGGARLALSPTTLLANNHGLSKSLSLAADMAAEMQDRVRQSTDSSEASSFPGMQRQRLHSQGSGRSSNHSRRKRRWSVRELERRQQEELDSIARSRDSAQCRELESIARNIQDGECTPQVHFL